MGRRRKGNKGFHTPFADVALPKPPEQEPEPKTPSQTPEVDPHVDEATTFQNAMAGVQPLDHHKSRVAPPKREQPPPGPTDDELALQELNDFVRGEGPFRLQDTDEYQWGLAPGVSKKLLRTLRRGGLSFRRHLDLHGFSREDAHGELSRFVTRARQNGERCVLVVTGRGLGSPDGVSVLQTSLPRWLSRSPLKAHVLAFCSARVVDGGPGAFYVLLRRAGVRPFGIGRPPDPSEDE